MAASKTITKTFDEGRGTVKLVLTETATSVSGNNSTWTAKLSISYSNKIYSSASKDYSMTINGKKYSGTWTIGSNSSTMSKTLKTVTGISIPHGGDGTKSFSASFAVEVGVNFNYSGLYVGTVSGSGTATATNIPRTTNATLSSSSVNLGSSVTVSLPRASTAFTHKIEQNVSGSYVTMTSNASTSYTLTVPTSWGSYISTSTSKSITIKVSTYSGSTYIGCMTLSLTVNVPTSVVPSISAVTITEATSGLASHFGVFIQTKSKFNIATSASGIYGSTIKSYAISCNGGNYTGASVTTGVITASGSVSIVVKVTDTRGRTATTTKTVSVVAYSNPSIASFNVYRCNSDGTSNVDGTSLGATAKFNVTSINGLNSKSYIVEYKVKTSTTWTTAITGSSYAVDSALETKVGVLSTSSSYDVRLTVSDYFMSTAVVGEVGTTFKLVNWFKKAMAIGKMSEIEDTFEVNLKSRFYKDVVIDEGLTVGGTNVKSAITTAQSTANTAKTMVTQNNSTTSNYRLVQLGTNNHATASSVPTSGSGALYNTTKLYAQSSTGNLYSSGMFYSGGYAVVARGANTNGTYTRYADGTQICIHCFYITPVANTTVSAAWTFPASFSTIDQGYFSIVVTPVTSVPYTILQGAAASNYATTSAKIYLRRTSSTNTNISCIAIGRWK